MGGLSDYIGRPKTFILLFVVNVVMAILLIVLQVPLVFVVAMAVLMTCYGAGFSLIPPYLSDIFGAKELATLHGYILTAWAMAALVGPMLLSVTYELTKSYQMTLLVFIALYVVALVIAYLLKKKVIRQVV
ncbi:oxalate/formate antiporter [Streptococcus dysgalactiae]|nr:oxalate/formate antiporter [Streptococcus dysgalactiae]